VLAFLKKHRVHLSLPLDVHLIAENPNHFLNEFEELDIDRLCIQFEDAKEIGENFLSLPVQKGLAVSTSTVLNTIPNELLTCLDFVMLMCTTPGESGGKFQKENFQKINRLKFEYPSLSVTIDGGVNGEVAFILRLLGVDTIVSCSFLMDKSAYGINLLSLLRPFAGDAYCVKDFMVEKQYLPVLQSGGFNFKQAVQLIEDHKTGYALVTNKEGAFEGVITNADIRRAVLKHWGGLDAISAGEFVNSSPIKLNENATVREMLKTIESVGRVILFLPVVNDQNELTGVVPLNNLAKG